MKRLDFGGAIIEFIIVVPLMVVFAYYLVALSRLIGQLIWVNRMAYEASVAGIRVPESVRDLTMFGVVNNPSGTFKGIETYQNQKRSITVTENENTTTVQPLELEPFDCGPKLCSGEQDFWYYGETAGGPGTMTNSVVTELRGTLPIPLASLIGMSLPFNDRIVAPILTLAVGAIVDLSQPADNLSGVSYGCCAGSFHQAGASCADAIADIANCH